MNSNKQLQLTLAILKPHVIKQPYALKSIQNKILEANFKLVRSKRQCLTAEQAKKFYEEHSGSFFYNRLVTFMTSGPSDFYILTQFDAIKKWRQIMGPTKVFKAQFTDPESIRGNFGLSDTRNATHGSDSPLSATREIQIFFPDFNIESWFKTDEKYFKLNKLRFIEKDFIHLPLI